MGYKSAYTASFLILAVVSLIAAGMLLGVNVPRAVDTPQEKSAARTLGQIVRQPTYLVALFSAVTGYGVMILAMTATSLAMAHRHHLVCNEPGCDRITRIVCASP